MKKDILTVSRVTRILNKINPDLQNVDLANTMSYAITLSSINSQDSINELFGIIKESQDLATEPINVINEFLLYVGSELNVYNAEIENRKEHAKMLGFYTDDTPEQLEEKANENKDIYIGDQYMSCYLLLSKNGVLCSELTISESLILMEDILCQQVVSNVHEILSILESDYKSFTEDMRRIIKHANFCAFALDIQSEVDKMYIDYQKKKEK